MVHSAYEAAQMSAEPDGFDTGSVMTTSGVNEPKPISEASTETWRVAISVARRERRQRGERYTARHRSAPANQGWQDTTLRSA
jgi:hypothetical protein